MPRIVRIGRKVSDGFFQVQEQNDLLINQSETDQARVGDGFPENGGGRKNPFGWHFKNPVNFRDRERIGFLLVFQKDHPGIGKEWVGVGEKGLMKIGNPEAGLALDFLIKGKAGGLAEVAGESRFPELEIDNFNFQSDLGI